MSFSGNIKNEILNNVSSNKKDIDLLRAEKFGEILTEAYTKKSLQEEFKKYTNISNLLEVEIKEILKGAFLGSGCIVDPNLDYHFEITTKSKFCADYILNLLSLLEFEPKMLKRKKLNTYTVYFKEADKISTFLSIIEANISMLEFEQVRVEKDVKNNINRNINCETANQSKIFASSLRQIEAIDKLKRNDKYFLLNDKLKYVASLRLKYKEESLEYIASKTEGENKLSKSGLKHRLDNIIKISEEI